MEKDVLSQVIEAEKEIQKCLESEKLKVRDWIEAVRKEFEEGFVAEQRQVTESLQESVSESAKQAEAAAAEIVEAADKQSARLGNLSPEALKRIVENRITKILPG